MLCPSLNLQPSSGSLIPFLEPMRTLWPTSRTIFARAEQDMIRMMKEMARTMEAMEEFHQRLLREATIPNRAPGGSLNSDLLGSRQTEKDGESFSMSLAAPGFSTNELTVKLVGRKLLVTGAKQTKNDDGQGSFYKYEVFKRESDLPEDVSLEDLTCSFSSNGQLHVEAPRRALPATAERNVPIQIISAATGLAAVGSSQSQGLGSKEHHKADGQGGGSMDQAKAKGQGEKSTDQGKMEGQGAGRVEKCKTEASGEGSTDQSKIDGQGVEEHSPLFARVMDKEREGQSVGPREERKNQCKPEGQRAGSMDSSKTDGQRV
ncbi:heat shock protein beta-9 [Lissotriton helveticus]